MSHENSYENPEPVPPVSQLYALPFVAGIWGYLEKALEYERCRVTLHRVMNRDGKVYLQQVCSYAEAQLDHSKAGRLFKVREGIIGKAFSERLIFRTKQLNNDEEWWVAYEQDRKDIGETAQALKSVVSWLAIPLLSNDTNQPVCILYAEAGGLNAFSDATRLKTIAGMCYGYCGVLDGLVGNRLPRFRNYPLPAGVPVEGVVTGYPRLQEAVQDPQPPKLYALESFNFAPAS